jgi:ribosomal protein S18 acetylase RimI-like enzyme
MTETISFRIATRDDLFRIVSLLSEDQLGSTRETLTDPLPQVYFEAFEAMMAQKENVYIVVEEGGEIVGCYQYTVIPGVSRSGASRAQIEGVRIDSKMRGKGLGQKMLEDAKQRARSSGCSLVQLTADKTRADAHRFYEEQGFVGSHIGFKLNL